MITYLEDRRLYYKLISKNEAYYIWDNCVDTDLCYDIEYYESTETFNYVGFVNSVISIQDNKRVLLKDFCKKLIEKNQNSLLCETEIDENYFGVLNKYIPPSDYLGDYVLPVFYCQSGYNFDEKVIVAPFYRIVCFPKSECK